jgi:hypothetical protein
MKEDKNMAHPQPVIEEMPDSQEQDGNEREQSQIAFPYQGLNDSIEIVTAVHQLHGRSASYEQVAAHLSTTLKSSSFRTKIAAAKVFNLISTGSGMVMLTNLGSRICDPQQEQAARAEAFLAVPLYKKVYEQFKSTTLPPATGLEAAFGTLGVAQKQRERARQIFYRSAQEAGFFQFGKEKLVMPAIKASTAPPVAPPEEIGEPEKKKKNRDDDEEDLHPFIKGLLTKLPKPDDEWSQEARAKWLETAANIFDLLYKNSDDNNRVISIRVEKDSAK